jgi:hypothetical protein
LTLPSAPSGERLRDSKSDFLFDYDDVLITHASQRLGVVTTETLSKIHIIVVSFADEQEGT